MTKWPARADMCIVLWMSMSQHATLRALLASVVVRRSVAAISDPCMFQICVRVLVMHLLLV